ncbi:MAG: response regulator transcription factor [Bacteroidetes bacterium]|nr:response regulator transcription factor [Bacteroidota bacterium]
MTALIIEDEPKAVLELKQILATLRPELVVVEMIGSVEEAINWFQHHQSPDLVFSDIQLSDGDSFEIFRKVKVKTPIIFCTAFDEYMQNAFEVNGIAYLLKPIVATKVDESLRKYDQLKASFSSAVPDYAEQMKNFLAQLRPNYQSSLLVHVREKIIPVKVNDISFFYYSNGVVSIGLSNGQSHFVGEQMDTLESKLDPSNFFRVNRQYIINRNSIAEIERYFSRKLSVRLTRNVPEPITIGKLKVTSFLEWMKK